MCGTHGARWAGPGRGPAEGRAGLRRAGAEVTRGARQGAGPPTLVGAVGGASPAGNLALAWASARRPGQTRARAVTDGGGDPEEASASGGAAAGKALTVIDTRPDTLPCGGDSDTSTFHAIVGRQEYLS
ncbi:hypothetical protein GCM10023324_31040 [Streptomyces youssoufiensis]